MCCRNLRAHVFGLQAFTKAVGWAKIWSAFIIVVGYVSVVDHVSKSILPQRVLCRGELRSDQLDGHLFGKSRVYSVLGLGIEYFVRQ